MSDGGPLPVVPDGRRAQGRRCLLLFDSIHHVLAAERVFKERGTWCDLVPVPRGLSSDCGMAIAFAEADLAAVGAVLADPLLAPGRVYRSCEAGFEPVALPCPQGPGGG